MSSQNQLNVIQAISEHKDAGNKHYSSGNFKNAIVSYSKALLLYSQLVNEEPDNLSVKNTSHSPLNTLTSVISSTITSITSSLDNVNVLSRPSSSEDLSPTRKQALVDQIKPHILYSNRSASFLHTTAYEYALEDAYRCIELMPEWPKGYFRKGEALIGLQRYDEALPALYRALERYGDDQASVDSIMNRIQFAMYSMQDKHRNFRIIQMLAGRDFAVSSWSPISALIFNYAKMMQNFVYAIACEYTKECLLVDVCWDVDGILDHVQKQGYTVVGAIVTHYHFDHVGGLPPPPYDQYRIRVDGLDKLLRKLPAIKAYVNSNDIPEVLNGNPDIPMDRLEPTHDGFMINLGKYVSIKCIHTPGHTPGSQCLLINENRLLSGDTLFIGNIGRLDFPDCNVEAMYKSMCKLKELPGDVMIYPGHEYGGYFTTMEVELEKNPNLLASNFNAFFVTAHGG